MEVECIHGLGPVEACTLCNGKAAAEARAEEEDRYYILRAKYEGDCNECTNPVSVGQLAVYDSKTKFIRHYHCGKQLIK